GGRRERQPGRGAGRRRLPAGPAPRRQRDRPELAAPGELPPGAPGVRGRRPRRRGAPDREPRRPAHGGRRRFGPAGGAGLRRPRRALLHPAPRRAHGPQAGLSPPPPPRDRRARRGGPLGRQYGPAAGQSRPPLSGAGQAPVERSMALAPARSTALRTTAKMAPWMAAASRISPQRRSRSRASGALSSCRISFQVFWKASPATVPLVQPRAKPIGL